MKTLTQLTSNMIATESLALIFILKTWSEDWWKIQKSLSIK